MYFPLFKIMFYPQKLRIFERLSIDMNHCIFDTPTEFFLTDVHIALNHFYRTKCKDFFSSDFMKTFSATTLQKKTNDHKNHKCLV